MRDRRPDGVEGPLARLDLERKVRLLTVGRSVADRSLTAELTVLKGGAPTTP